MWFNRTPEQIMAKAHARALRRTVAAALAGPVRDGEEAKARRADARKLLEWLVAQNPDLTSPPVSQGHRED